MSSGSPIPPSGFRWAEPQAEAADGSPKRRWTVLVAVITVVVLIGGGVGAFVWWQDRDRTPLAEAAREPAPIGTPPDLLVSFPLDRQPVPSWRLSATDVGLPPGKIGEIVGTVGQNAYFLAYRNCEGRCENPVSYLYGVDTDSGKPLFAPVVMPGFGVGECHLNGPDVALCNASSPVDVIARTNGPPTVWVIDLRDGRVTYTGPTDLDTETGPRIVDVGGLRGTTRAVAEIAGKGIYGIGDRGELTWFAPGNGDIASSLDVANDIPAPTLTLQNAVDIGGLTRVISVIDGRDLTPQVPDGTTIEKPQIYNGGFAYQFDEQGGKSGTLFFDTDGKQVGRQDNDRSLLQRNREVPVLMVGSNLQVYTADGKLVTQMPAYDIISRSQVIGTKFYLYQGGYSADAIEWQQWDLLSGKPGATCQFQLEVSYIASDGNVIVTRRSEDTMAIDPTTCTVLWTYPQTNGLWKVGTNLIHRELDQMSLTGLQAPA